MDAAGLILWYFITSLVLISLNNSSSHANPHIDLIYHFQGIFHETANMHILSLCVSCWCLSNNRASC